MKANLLGTVLAVAFLALVFAVFYAVNEIDRAEIEEAGGGEDTVVALDLRAVHAALVRCETALAEMEWAIDQFNEAMDGVMVSPVGGSEGGN